MLLSYDGHTSESIQSHQLVDNVLATGHVGDSPAEGLKREASGPGLNGTAELHPQDVGDRLGGVEGGEPSFKKQMES